jgi:hypothetical protein
MKDVLIWVLTFRLYQSDLASLLWRLRYLQADGRMAVAGWRVGKGRFEAWCWGGQVRYVAACRWHSHEEGLNASPDVDSGRI